MDDNVISSRFGYRDVLGTPSESAFSVSPTSSSFLHSPSRSSFTIESPSPCGTSFSVDTDPSPQGTTKDLQEFLQVLNDRLHLKITTVNIFKVFENCSRVQILYLLTGITKV